ncbi:Fe(3+)-hydroxamate ABC transporter permease FhuB [Avibacterium gallinarum]|uniref:Fe(3+) dicitrate transport system permease protein FecC n=1 Tax=Avibacterium gallinarum TaxID=755 RepID=A0A379AX33_AVIGA|nr:Fe(3+)-hydroxamate ABC transporter permease FhuB [Avibacterium gallinarum]POY44496.1 Fe(3+)-hydroxamate ABC transporter permease FhuB [Avibacterium gallinarum]TDP30278.1 iron complex transport system permease protein [Avibacterium gallinarum]SUB26778.1 Fe(3+) dicitrate transport system permease protein FecC [Avibacterium gallinarum]
MVKIRLMPSLGLIALALFALLLWQQPEQSETSQLLIFNFTLPRVLMAILAGASLGVASLLLQQIMNNSLASDSTLAVSGGAQFALFLATLFLPNLLQFGTTPIAFIGALFALGLVLLLAWRQMLSPLLIVLAGLVVSFYLGAFSSLLMLFYPEESRGLLVWGSGSLVQESWYDSLTLLPLLAPAIVGIVLLSPALQILQLQESNAQSLGVNVKRIRLLGVLLAAYLVAIIVSRVGMIAFIGLAATTLARQYPDYRFKILLWRSAYFASILLLIADLCLQLIEQWQGISLPTGSITALFGTPLLLWLVFKHRQQYGRVQESQSAWKNSDKKSTALYLPLFLAAALGCSLFLAQGVNGWQVYLDQGLFNLRFPRLAYALCAGIMLALAGTILQRLSRNPMASPELLGITSGVSFGVLLAIFVAGASVLSQYVLWGALGALLILGLIWLINRRNGLQPDQVLLTGISISALFDAVQRILIASGDPRAWQLLSWGSGSTYYANNEVAIPMLIIVAALFALSFIFIRWLDLLSLNSVVAQSLGVNLVQSRSILFLFAILLTLLATLIVGSLSFIGLLAPHLAYSLGFRQSKTQLLAAGILGGTVMIMADWLGRQLLFPYEIPAGLVATLLGGTYFLWLMRKM